MKTLLLRVSVASLGLLAAHSARAQEAAVDVFVRAGDEYAYRIPSLVVSSSGTLLAFCERRVGLHDHAQNDIVLRRSADGGASWEPIQVLADAGADSLNDPCAVVLDSGRVLLRYKRYPQGVHQRKSRHTVMAEPGYGGPKNVRVYLRHSDDEGRTWSAPREVTRAMRRESSISVGSPGAAIQLTRGAHKGRIVFPNYEGVRVSESERTFVNSVCYSDDGGESWTLSPVVEDHAIAPAHGNEAQLAELVDGSILMSTRLSGPSVTAGRKLARSTDAGASWGDVRVETALETPACMSSVIRYTWPSAGEPGVLLHSLPNTKNSRANGTLFASRDDGGTWTRVLTIEPGAFAYSCLARLPNGDVGCLYETGRGESFRLVFKRIAVPAVVRAPIAPLQKAFIDGAGWTPLTLDDFVNVNGKPDTWTDRDGVIVCTGKPLGGARTKKQYTNFEMVVEWKHHVHAGNSGVFLWCPESAFTDLPPGKLPRSGIEVQVLDLGYEENWLKSKGSHSDWFTSHGDVFPVGGSSMTAFTPQIEYAADDGTKYAVGNPNSKRSFPTQRRTRRAGEWNHYYIRAINGQVRLWVNGVEVNGGTQCSPATGYLALEAEGALVEYRNLRIRELP